MTSTIRPFEYMAWAQSLPGRARLNLAQSGIADVVHDPGCPEALLASIDTAPLCDRGLEGRAAHAHFLETVGARYGLPPTHVVPSLGASLSIMHVLMALVQPGDRVVVEQPAYEALIRAPEVLGAEVVRLERRASEAWRVDLPRLETLCTPGTKCVLLTNLHNPSGARMERATLEALGELCAERDIFLLVDEVYLDFCFDASPGSPAPPAALAAPTGVSWSSSTKCFGVSAARAGWIVTRHEAALAAIKNASRYLHVDVPVATAVLGARVLEHATELTARANRFGDEGRAIMEAWAQREHRVRWQTPAFGLCGLLHLPSGLDAHTFVDHLLDHHGALVVPGDLFECPGAVRLGFGCPADELREGLDAISRTLDALAASPSGESPTSP